MPAKATWCASTAADRAFTECGRTSVLALLELSEECRGFCLPAYPVRNAAAAAGVGLLRETCLTCRQRPMSDTEMTRRKGEVIAVIAKADGA
jgi:hypothetical protein